MHGPEHEAIRRRYIETPSPPPYIYTLAEESTRTGIPMMRPIFLEFPEVFTPPSSGFGSRIPKFPFGPACWVRLSRSVRLSTTTWSPFPSGDWYDFWTGLKTPIPPPEPSIVQVRPISPRMGWERSIRSDHSFTPRSNAAGVRAGREHSAAPTADSEYRQIPSGPSGIAGLSRAA